MPLFSYGNFVIVTATVSPETEHQAIAFRNEDGSTKGHFGNAVTPQSWVARCTVRITSLKSKTLHHDECYHKTPENPMQGAEAHLHCSRKIPFVLLDDYLLVHCTKQTPAAAGSSVSPPFLRGTVWNVVFNNELPLYSVQLV